LLLLCRCCCCCRRNDASPAESIREARISSDQLVYSRMPTQQPVWQYVPAGHALLFAASHAV
jgi:hypothetical protein